MILERINRNPPHGAYPVNASFDRVDEPSLFAIGSRHDFRLLRRDHVTAARYLVAVTDGVAVAWLQVEGVLWLLGSMAWIVGLAQQWRLRRRFREKTGKDMYGLDEVADRYIERPWLWLLEAPGVTRRMMAVGTTPIADAELEAMRRTFRRSITAGGLCIVIAITWFLGPIAWLLVTRW
jgi:hypothetical protein